MQRYRTLQYRTLQRYCTLQRNLTPSFMPRTSRCQRRAVAASSSDRWINGEHVQGEYLRSRPERLLVVLRHHNPPSRPHAGDNVTLAHCIAWFGLWKLKLTLCGGLLRSAAAEVELGRDSDVDFQVESLGHDAFREIGSFLANQLASYAQTLWVVLGVSIAHHGPVIALTIQRRCCDALIVQLVNTSHFRHSGLSGAPDFTCNLLVAVPLILGADLLQGAPLSKVGLHTKTSHLAECQRVELRLLPGAPVHYTVGRVIYECRQLVFGVLKDPAEGTMPDRLDRFLARRSRHPRSRTERMWSFVPGLGRQPTYLGERCTGHNAVLGPVYYFA